MAREVLGITGAIIGGVYGGPAGAQAGFMVGSALGAVIDGPTKIPGAGLSEAPIQTSRDGVPIPIIWGLHHCHGNIIQKNPEWTETTSTSQGKGGGTKTEETRRYRTYAVGVCRGLIAEYTRIWENEKLVYDNRAVPSIPAAESTAYAAGLRFYTGDEGQLPDPDLESHWGVGTTPAYRGLAYIVWVNKDLTDFGGAIPQYRFEVNGSKDATVTSKPYPADAVDGLIPQITFPDGWLANWPIEAIETETIPVGGGFGGGIITYAYVEAIETLSLPFSGSLGEVLVIYSYIEAIETETIPVGGNLGAGLIIYSYTEAIETTTTPEDGTLT